MKVFRTWTLVLVASLGVAGAALGAIACNDDGESLTLEEYFQKVDEIDNDSTERIDANFETISDEGDVQQFRDAFKGFAPILEDVAGEFDDLDPPDAAKEKHDAMASALNAFSEKVNDLADGVDEINASTPDEFFAAIEEQGFAEADDAFTTACLDLQQFATDSNITIELDCADDEEASGEGAAAAEQTVRDVAAAWNASDIEAFGALFTDAGLASVFAEGEDVPREEVLASVEGDIGVGDIEIRELSSELSDAGAEVTVLWASGEVMEHYRFSLIDDSGSWKIDGEEVLPVEAPEGVPAVQIHMREFSFDFDPADIPDGAFYLQFDNAGQQTHHAIMARVPADLDLQAALMSDEDPPGVTDIGGIAPQEPGDGDRIVFRDELQPGRYVLLCFLPDTDEGEDGTPHALKGMVGEFTIEEPAARVPTASMLPRL